MHDLVVFQGSPLHEYLNRLCLAKDQAIWLITL